MEPLNTLPAINRFEMSKSHFQKYLYQEEAGPIGSRAGLKARFPSWRNKRRSIRVLPVHQAGLDGLCFNKLRFITHLEPIVPQSAPGGPKGEELGLGTAQTQSEQARRLLPSKKDRVLQRLGSTSPLPEVTWG